MISSDNLKDCERLSRLKHFSELREFSITSLVFGLIRTIFNLPLFRGNVVVEIINFIANGFELIYISDYKHKNKNKIKYYTCSFESLFSLTLYSLSVLLLNY